MLRSPKQAGAARLLEDALLRGVREASTSDEDCLRDDDGRRATEFERECRRRSSNVCQSEFSASALFCCQKRHFSSRYVSSGW